MNSNQNLLKISGLSVTFNQTDAVSNVNFSLKQGEIGSIVGPSGCGKSTLLRSIAGFEQPRAGTIELKGVTVSSPEYLVAPEKRGVGMVFQDISLFPHLSTAKNIAFGLRDWNAEDTRRRVNELLDLIGLSGYGNRHPSSLSGGEQQRVSLARAIARKPDLLLLDEAFSSLDQELKQSLVAEVREILIAEKISAIAVTHDHNVAFAIADRVGVMRTGKIHQWDTPYNIYHNPQTEFAARFIGEGSLIPAAVVNERSVETIFGRLRLNNCRKLPNIKRGRMLVRPDNILHDADSLLRAKVEKRSFRGSHFLYRMRLENGQTFDYLDNSHKSHQVGDWIGIRPDFEHIVIFDDEE